MTLPGDFRTFLAAIGNGGAGPFYGVFPLGKVDDNFDLRDWTEVDVGILSEPFPFDEEWNDLSAKPRTISLIGMSLNIGSRWKRLRVRTGAPHR